MVHRKKHPNQSYAQANLAFKFDEFMNDDAQLKGHVKSAFSTFCISRNQVSLAWPFRRVCTVAGFSLPEAVNLITQMNGFPGELINQALDSLKSSKQKRKQN